MGQPDPTAARPKLAETPRRIYKERSDRVETLLVKELGPDYAEYRTRWLHASRREYLSPFPLYLQIEHSGKCNLSCIGCVQGVDEIHKNYVPASPPLSPELYKKLLEEARQYSCPSISFHSNDEPLLLRDLEDRIRLAKDMGFIDLILTTNATLMTKGRADKLLASGLTKINFSVDAHRKDDYEKIRIGGNFDVMMENIAYFLEQKKTLGQILPITRVTCVLNKYSASAMNEFEKFWGRRVDVVEFQNFQAIRGHTEDLRPPESKLDTGFSCNAPWQQLVVRANGDVLPCCSFYGVDIVLGKFPSESLHSLWNGKPLQKMREQMAKENYRFCKACHDCSVSNYVM